MQSPAMEEPTVNEQVQTTDPSATYSYDDLFPALPEHHTTPAVNNAPPKSMRVGSSVVTQVFRVPCEERKCSDSEKFGEGESLRTCQQIMKETGAHIEISSSKDESLTFLVKGKINEVLDARRKILVHFQTQASKQISIPKEHHGMILGKKAERLKCLEKLTATKISVPNMNEDSDVITISGTKEDIEKAEHEIRVMSDEQSKKAYERISIPKIYHPFIIGPFSETLNSLTEVTGAKIVIPPQNVMTDEILITGEKEKVFAAKEKIIEIYKDMEKKCSTVSVEVSKSQHRYVIGQRFSTIQEILKLTGVSVEMPPPDSNTDTITLRGPQAALGNALTVVYQKANSAKSVFLDAPAWVHKYIIGKKGAISNFEEEYPNVNMMRIENKIKLEGPPEMVEKAEAHLAALVDEYTRTYTYTVMNVDPNHYKHIIGKAGANINRLKNELNVMINIDDKEDEHIRIEGPIESVEKAKQELQAQIDKLENEKTKKVQIDRRLYRSMFGNKGENIREIKEKYKQVQIHFPAQNENNDTVKLYGPRDDVDKCHKDLMKLVKEVQKSNFRIEVPIFKQSRKFIIGKGGANIKKIRDETQTKIDLPAEGDSNEMIVITGKKENVLDAKERIEKIQNELIDIATDEVQIPSKYYNTLIGPINKLIEEHAGVTIRPKSKSDTVTLRGPKDEVEKAKIQLLELTADCQQSLVTLEVRAQQQHHKFIIGKSGASIKKICEASGARVFFPGNEDEDKELITILGKDENAKKAKEMLENVIKEIEEVTEDEIAVDPKHHKHFVSKRREVLHRITEECGGVMISFPKVGTDSDRVVLKGAKDYIEAAKQKIQEIVDDLEAQVTIECIIPQKHHRKVMGVRGVRIQNITSTYDVQIKIPDRATGEEPEQEVVNGGEDEVRQCDIIRITGRQDKCEAAKQALLDLIPVTEDINVPFDFHRSIIGQKGNKVREFMSTYDVHIELSPPEMKMDVIKITGTPANVADAKEAIFKRVEELDVERKERELRSFELKIEVDPQYISKIIGPKGSHVKKLRQDYNVNISFPRREDTDDHTITIQGYEKDAQACKGEIMRIVNDLDELAREVVDVDHRVHKRLIGQRGRNIRRIMDEYKVEIKLAKPGEENPNAVTIIGSEESVLEAKDHILNLAEEYLQDVADTVSTPTNDFSTILQQAFNKSGFVVQGAPWERGNGNQSSADGNTAPNTQSHEDFPDFGLSNNVNNDHTAAAAVASPSVWGPRR